MERLQKVLAKAGIASRRRSDEIIAAGRVKVNGAVVTEMGTKVDWTRDLIEVDGKKLTQMEELVYLILHKPKGYVTTLRDPQHRKKIADLVKDLPQRVFPVGRLDFDTAGLLIMTNDGDLAQAITHPRFGVEKTYVAKVFGTPLPQKIKTLRMGVMLEDGLTAPAQVRLLNRSEGNAILEIKIREGRNRQVRRMCQAIGHPVMELTRTQIGFLELGHLPPGSYRHLTEAEVDKLKKAVKFKNYSNPEARAPSVNRSRAKAVKSR
jgi:pseudouridine synthase